MAFSFDQLTKKARDMAAVAADKAKDVATVAADKAKDAAETTRINMAISSEQRDIDKNCQLIGEWLVNEYEGEIPEAIRDVVDAVNASKAKIAELEASRPNRDSGGAAAETAEQHTLKTCPSCGAMSDSMFCPKCGASMEG